MSNVLFLKILRQLYEISIVKGVISNGTSFIWVSTPEVGCTFLLAFHFSFSQVLAVFPRLLTHFHSNTCWGTNSTKKYSPFRTLSQTNDLAKLGCCERRCWLGFVFFFLVGSVSFRSFFTIAFGLHHPPGADLGGGCRGCAPPPGMTCSFVIN